MDDVGWIETIKNRLKGVQTMCTAVRTSTNGKFRVLEFDSPIKEWSSNESFKIMVIDSSGEWYPFDTAEQASKYIEARRFAAELIDWA
jgi:hypothetical protein